jgi:hypothetical protein
MSKTITVCPFSKMVCRECAIYRGRHVELCAASRQRTNGTSAKRPEKRSSAALTCWEFPDIPDSPGRMVNIEDFIERRGM